MKKLRQEAEDKDISSLIKQARDMGVVENFSEQKVSKPMAFIPESSN